MDSLISGISFKVGLLNTWWMACYGMLNTYGTWIISTNDSDFEVFSSYMICYSKSY